MPRVTAPAMAPSPATAGRHASRPLPLALVVLGSLLLAGCLAGCGSPRRLPTSAERPTAEPEPVPARMEEPGEQARPFVLTDQAGEAFDSRSLAGKVWVGSVFFANCPGPCFRENQALADMLREIDSPDLVVVSLTCDPENDTPEVLRRYAERFDADTSRWKFLTGDMETIKTIANQSFRLPAEVGVHSERGVVFDRQGRLRGGYHLLQADRVDLLKKLVREVLEEPADDRQPAPAGDATAAGADR